MIQRSFGSCAVANHRCVSSTVVYRSALPATITDRRLFPDVPEPFRDVPEVNLARDRACLVVLSA